MTAEQQAILDAIKGVTSANPVPASVIFKSMTGMDFDAFLAELDHLFLARYINGCSITRDSEPVYVYWPTGFKGMPMTKDPIAKEAKEAKPKRTEPLKWAELKQQKTKLNLFEESEMSAKPTKAELIRKLIDAKPYISHTELMYELIGDDADDVTVRKAKDMIAYTLKSGKYTKHISEIKGQLHVVQYYKTSDKLDDKQANEVLAAKIKPLGQLDISVGIGRLGSVNLLATNPAEDWMETEFNPTKNTALETALDMQMHECNIHNKQADLFIDFIKSKIIEYVGHYKNKNDIDEIKKAQHAIELLIEMQATNAFAQ
jgi:hypothetical protein